MMDIDEQKAILEWALWANLEGEKELELILLKGHIYLDLILNGLIKENKLSFYGKIKNIYK